MRKNIKAVIDAFKRGEACNEGTCSTNGQEVFSYAMKIAERKKDGTITVIDIEHAPSNTTRGHIHAVAQEVK